MGAYIITIQIHRYTGGDDLIDSNFVENADD
jgi:hypothetical protein